MMSQLKANNLDKETDLAGKLNDATSVSTALGDALRKINVAGFFKGALEGSDQLIQRAGEYRAAMDTLAAAAQRNGASAGEMDAAYRSAVGVLGSASASADVVSAAGGRQRGTGCGHRPGPDGRVRGPRRQSAGR